MRIFCTDRNRLHIGVVQLVHMLVDESRVQKSMRESEDHVLSKYAEVELPNIGPRCRQIFHFEAMSHFVIINEDINEKDNRHDYKIVEQDDAKSFAKGLIPCLGVLIPWPLFILLNFVPLQKWAPHLVYDHQHHV